jgi:hypothetical protein
LSLPFCSDETSKSAQHNSEVSVEPVESTQDRF